MLDIEPGKIITTLGENTIPDVGGPLGFERKLSVQDQAANVAKGMVGKFLGKSCTGRNAKRPAPYPRAVTLRAMSSDISVASK
jgi:hypothetical protein